MGPVRRLAPTGGRAARPVRRSHLGPPRPLLHQSVHCIAPGPTFPARVTCKSQVFDGLKRRDGSTGYYWIPKKRAKGIQWTPPAKQLANLAAKVTAALNRGRPRSSGKSSLCSRPFTS